MTSRTPPVPETPAAPYEAERGYRYVRRVLPDGSEEWTTVPITDAEFLDPQEGDVMPERPSHARARVDLFTMLSAYVRRAHPNLTVFTDLKIDWGIPGLENPGPDLAVVPNVRDPRAIEGTFYVQQEGARPALVIEIISPGYVRADLVDKARIYARAGVREYVILDPGGFTEQPVRGYRLRKGRYQPLPLDEEGLVECATVAVLIGLAGEQVVVVEAETGQRLRTYEEEAARAEAEAARAEAEAARAEAEAARAEVEAAARAEAEARAAALEAELKRLRGEA